MNSEHFTVHFCRFAGKKRPAMPVIEKHFYRDNPEQSKHHFNSTAASHKKFMNIIIYADVVTILPP
ncbi:hypothetical protein MJO10_32240, partial [Salmonella enterica subsp. enterica serovar Anatum]|nr:hypothetical protein [Salmonella enterica subsp. enterica serovar Anatum]